MTRTEREKKKTLFFHIRSRSISQNSLNEFNSKSLIANVVSINHDFKESNKINRRESNKESNQNRSLNLTTKNRSQYCQAYLNRENSNQSQLGNYDSFDSALFSSGKKHDVTIFRRILVCILKEVKHITRKIQDSKEEEIKDLDWKFAAMVIDRLCLVVFSVSTIIITVSILMTSKNFFVPSDPDPIF